MTSIPSRLRRIGQERRKPIVAACLATFVATIAAAGTVSAQGQPGAPGPSTTTPAPEANTSATTAISDHLVFFRLGAGGTVASGFKGGPAFGSGYRYNWDRYGIDVSFFNWVLTKSGGPSFDNPAGPWLRVALVSYADPFAPSSVYYGAGLGWGTTQATINNVHFSNFGADIGLFAGLEMHRTGMLRWFVQVDLELPTYAAHGQVPSYESTSFVLTTESRYMPSFSLSLGLAFGTPRVAAPASPTSY